MQHPLTYSAAGGVATITIDDGKVNVMSLALLIDLSLLVERARAERAMIVLRSGRESIFSAGFDMKTLSGGNRDAATAMLGAGVRLIVDLLQHPYPVISVCSGHAYPMGAFLLMASDMRIGIRGDYLIGLNEVAIGIAVPDFALALARYRLAAPYAHRTAVLGEMFGPDDAMRAGFLDLVVERDAAEATLAQALRQLGKLDMAAHASTKQRMRAAVVEEISEALARRLLPAA